MSGTVGYYRGAGEAEDAMAVLAKWISGNRGIRVQYHDGTAVDADVEKGIIRVPRMACASGVTEDALMLLRGRVYHESGHVDESRAVAKKDYPQNPAKFSIWNALEDRRMEHVEADKHPGAKLVFGWNTDYYNREIAGKISRGEVDQPLWEAMVACSFQLEGRAPLWKLTPKAKAYFDAAYGEFIKVRQCKDARDTLALAERIYEILKKVSKDLQKDAPKQGKPQKGQQGKGKPEKGEKGGEPQQGGAGDIDDEGGEGESEDGEPKKGKSGKKDEKDGEESDGDKKSKGKGKDKKDAGDEGDGEGDGDDQDGDEDGQDGSGGAGEDGDDEDAESDAEGDSEGDGEGDGDGDSEGEGDGDGDGEGSADGDGDAEGGKETDGEPNGDVKPGDAPYDGKDEEPRGGNGKGDKRELEDEVGGVSQEQVANEALEKLFGEMDPADLDYISRRDLDEHMHPNVDDDDKAEFKRERDEVSVGVVSLTQALTQALRSLTRCRKKPYLRRGRIDHKRLVAIAKGLSKEVFFREKDGVELDVAVAMTIDESGSMGNYMQVRLLAMAIGEALQAIGVPFEIIGSTTRFGGGDRGMPPMDGFSRVNPILYKHYKDFQEAWPVVRHRMVKTGCHMHNVDGEVVEYAAFRLAQRRERRKVVFSLSDGEPCAGHGNDGSMAKNLKRVCGRVRKQGIEVYGFGVGTEGPRPLYGAKHFVFLEGTENMGPAFVRKFADVVTGGMVRV